MCSRNWIASRKPSPSACIRELAERYGTPLPRLEDEVAVLSAKVEAHLKNMGAVWK